MTKVRLVVLGLGHAGRQLHLPAIARIDDLTLVAAADPAAREAAVFTHWRDALEVPADAVLIATPPDTHYELAMAALGAGRHVYLEKPMATSLQEARNIADKQADTQLTVQLGFAYRFHPLWRRVKGRGIAGPLHAQARFFAARAGEGWAAPEIDLGCHHLDLLTWLLGSAPTEVRADGGQIVARWTDGSTLAGEYGTGPPSDVMTLDNRFTIDRMRGTRLRGGLPDLGLAVRHRINPEWEGSFEAALRAFARTIGQPAEEAAGPRDGLRAVAAAEAILRSIASAQPEKIEAVE